MNTTQAKVCRGTVLAGPNEKVLEDSQRTGKRVEIHIDWGNGLRCVTFGAVRQFGLGGQPGTRTVMFLPHKESGKTLTLYNFDPEKGTGDAELTPAGPVVAAA